MDFNEVMIQIARHRRLTSISSLPFIKMDGGKRSVMWFNYTVDQTDDEIALSVSDILTMDEDGTIHDEKAGLSIYVAMEEIEEPELTDVEYIEELAKLYDDYDEVAMRALLNRAEIKVIIPAYHAAANFNKAQEVN